MARRRQNYPQNFAEAASRIARGSKLKVDHNTYLVDAQGSIELTLHGHPIVRFFPDGRIQARHAGYPTRTTVSRLVGAGLHANIKQGVLYVHIRGGADSIALEYDWRTVRDADARVDRAISGAIKPRLEYLRGELRAERISYAEIHELQSLAPYIDKDDVELLEAAGVPEHKDEDKDND